MRERPVFHKELGDFLREQRTAKGWTMRQAAMLAKERGLSALTRQILFRLERGQIKTPEPEVLQAVAALYKLPYTDLVNRWTRAHFGIERDLVGHSGDQASDLNRRSDAAASAAQTRIQQLERELEAKDRFIAQTQAAALRLFSLYASAAKGGGAGKAQSGRRGARRNTG